MPEKNSARVGENHEALPPGMNGATYTVAKILKIDLRTARKVQTEMEIDGLDFSECSMAEFRRAAKDAYDFLKVKM